MNKSPLEKSILEEFIEKGADLEHARWSRWQKYLHSKCLLGSKDGKLRGLLIPPELVERWEKQIKTKYSELSETEKESDRKEVREYIPLVLSSINKAYQQGREEGTLFGTKKSLDWVDGVAEGMKYLTHDLKQSLNPCTFFTDHEPVWDGNYYTCSKCGIEFLHAREVNKALSDLQQELKAEHKETR